MKCSIVPAVLENQFVVVPLPQGGKRPILGDVVPVLTHAVAWRVREKGPAEPVFALDVGISCRFQRFFVTMTGTTCLRCPELGEFESIEQAREEVLRIARSTWDAAHTQEEIAAAVAEGARVEERERAEAAAVGRPEWVREILASHDDGDGGGTDVASSEDARAPDH